MIQSLVDLTDAPILYSAMYSLQSTVSECEGRRVRMEAPNSGSRWEKGNLTLMVCTRTCSYMSHAHRTCRGVRRRINTKLMQSINERFI